MAKNIIFCADGTWNHPVLDLDRKVLERSTNVYKLYKILEQSSQQIAVYDDGVGAGDFFPEHLLAGAVGDGLFDKIKDGYTKIAHLYQPEDRIFLFGFSRGAYTVRCLAGMIAEYGLPDPKLFSKETTDKVFSAYRERDPKKSGVLLSGLQTEFGNAPVKITMIGVWDTVGSMGIPNNLVPDANFAEYGFLDLKLHSNVQAAYHALSIDEKRREFQPTLWEAPSSDQILEQVWFPGVHSDVGGGYAEHGLSDITLIWMIGNAKKRGVVFDEPLPLSVQAFQKVSALDKIHESWNPFWLDHAYRELPANSKISDSVQFRAETLKSYRPPNLKGLPAALDPGFEVIKLLEG